MTSAAYEPKMARRERSLQDAAGLSLPQLLEIYHYLVLTRRLEEVLVVLQRQGQATSTVYRSLGQEGTAVGCAYGLQPEDFIQPVIRDLGAMLVHGVRVVAIFQQYLGRATGPTAGRDLNMHFSSPENGIIGPVSMLGVGVPVICGCLLAARRQHRRRAGLVFIGDGGSSTGAFYEGCNFAAVQGLPLTIVIEANHYAYSTPTTAQLPNGDLLTRARGFGMHTEEIDGNDVLACYAATRAARQRGASGLGPSILIAQTYRRAGHAEHDGRKYLADKTLPARWAADNDPLDRLRQFLLLGGYVSAARLLAIEGAVSQTIDTARAQALGDPLPDGQNQPFGVFADDGPSPIPPPETWLGGGAQMRSPP